ncbi:FAD-dependent monooxygenase [Chitinophaga pendula]|uniref:FAD-dependent oxidoreductase n=1 Tax=Chitinophaga TaxID=79328 RepID=UPI000BB08605|nr:MULTISPECIES: NAD(P)/FAD-dependent oxidoreductase [Chitinophaga]ASZ12783.1 2-polyprenyl-6-methoxyphenol hydroxylase [Chitinophaga sp. MD30]UCJ09596.1 FAD-dependent monooxygenase [Chitinophaga pendula]
MNNNITDKQIAIVGGGPGGLTLARLLEQAGAQVKVYERDINSDVRIQGATLDLHEESGLAALEKAGLTAAFKANYRPGADKTRIVDKHTHIVFDDHLNNRQSDRPEIDRGPLRKILLNALHPDTVVWDSQFIALHPDNGGWQLQFKNGASAFADIVVAADGANSRIRPYITDIKPFYSGVTVIEGTVADAETNIPVLHELLKGGKVFAMGDSKSLILSTKGDGSVAFYTGCHTPEYWYRDNGLDFTDNKQVLNWFHNTFAGWHSDWDNLFRKAKAFTIRPQYCMPPDQTWTSLPNLTMLGDAAHLMPPYAGEGVNMAMLDALELSNCLLDNALPDIASAIAHYEQQMRARAGDVARLTLHQTDVLHAPDAIPNLLEIFS